MIERPLHEFEVSRLAQELGREVVPQVVQAKVFHSCPLPKTPPRRLYPGISHGITLAFDPPVAGSLRHVGKHMLRVLALEGPQDAPHGRCNGNRDASAALALFLDAGGFPVDFRPACEPRSGLFRDFSRRFGTFGAHSFPNRRRWPNVPAPQIPGFLGILWSGRRDSNTRPSAPKADALPGCATPRESRSTAPRTRPYTKARRVFNPSRRNTHGPLPKIVARTLSPGWMPSAMARPPLISRTARTGSLEGTLSSE